MVDWNRIAETLVLIRNKMLVIALGLWLSIPSFAVHQCESGELNPIIAKHFAGWNIVTKEMLSGKPYDEYPGVSSVLLMNDGSNIVLLYKIGSDEIFYMVVRIKKGSNPKVLFRDEWPKGNPNPFLSPNKESRVRDIKTKREWAVNPQYSFVLDEWAYRWVLAEIKGKWQKILVQSED